MVLLSLLAFALVDIFLTSEVHMCGAVGLDTFQTVR